MAEQIVIWTCALHIAWSYVTCTPWCSPSPHKVFCNAAGSPFTIGIVGFVTLALEASYEAIQCMSHIQFVREHILCGTPALTTVILAEWNPSTCETSLPRQSFLQLRKQVNDTEKLHRTRNHGLTALMTPVLAIFKVFMHFLFRTGLEFQIMHTKHPSSMFTQMPLRDKWVFWKTIVCEPSKSVVNWRWSEQYTGLACCMSALLLFR